MQFYEFYYPGMCLNNSKLLNPFPMMLINWSIFNASFIYLIILQDNLHINDLDIMFFLHILLNYSGKSKIYHEIYLIQLSFYIWLYSACIHLLLVSGAMGGCIYVHPFSTVGFGFPHYTHRRMKSIDLLVKFSRLFCVWLFAIAVKWIRNKDRWFFLSGYIIWRFILNKCWTI